MTTVNQMLKTWARSHGNPPYWLVLWPPVEQTLLHGFPEILPVSLCCYSLEEIAAEKLRALLQSRPPHHQRRSIGLMIPPNGGACGRSLRDNCSSKTGESTLGQWHSGTVTPGSVQSPSVTP